MSLLVVLVRPHSPGNLGAVARACKNFGATLALVDPRTPPFFGTADTPKSGDSPPSLGVALGTLGDPGDREAGPSPLSLAVARRRHPDARAFASGAEDLLDQALELSSLADLPPGAARVVGLTSARGRDTRGLPPRVSWSTLRRTRPIALVFGPERGGLTREELLGLSDRASLPTRPEFPTLNLAQAVAATLALLQPTDRRPAPDLGAPAADVARLLERWAALLGAAGYAGPERPRRPVEELAAFFRRARPSPREVELLLAAFGALERSGRGAPDEGRTNPDEGANGS